MSKQNIRLLALDIETTGANLIHNAMIAIGFCLGDPLGNVIEKGRFCFAMEKHHVYEKRALTEFWDHHKDILEIITKEARPIESEIKRFADILDGFDKKYDLRIITDNPQFDVGFINYYFAKYLNRNPISYKFGTIYRPIYDTDSYSRGVLKMGYKSMWTDDKFISEKFQLQVTAKPTHLPDDDAEYIYKFHTSLTNKLNEIKANRINKSFNKN
jgi:DNA polymerase III epsilon subunit-like protein